VLVFTDRECVGHPCQKHPSTNTATLCFVNAMSIVLRKSNAGLKPTLYLSPSA